MSSRRGLVRALSVAPMMEWTDRHFRWLVRQISRRTLLYTEMVTTGAALHGEREIVLGFDPSEGPLALQLGGDDPQALAECARIAEGMGYDEVNLNVGCPSDRVQGGNFGACLMRQPSRVAACVAAMRAAVSLPVTVKHRIGVDGRERYEDMLEFVDAVAAEGCDRFTVHARIAILAGLSPKENRTVPPLRYPEVYRLKAERPGLVVEINGGVRSLDAAAEHMRAGVDAVMIGRAAYEDPYCFAEVDRRFFGETEAPPSRFEVARRYGEHADAHLRAYPRRKASAVLRHVLGLFTGQPGAREFRRILSETRDERPPSVRMEAALTAVRRAHERIAEHRAAAGS
ncbi:tRNA dihydrouridine(20/20a) synthase DusA [Nannocystis pusilla]|uniref:tRNA dihydrouridine(20/20a) synthase DusA n=1 Tax=Nannocystis pusilla TaxID=889268 RepID=UPI003B7E385F